VVGDVGGERRLAHAGPAREDDEVGFLQAAHLAVEVAQAGCKSGQFAVALIGMRRHLERGGERGLEAQEAAAIASGLRQVVEAPLGVLDLLARREVDRRVEGHVDHLLADLDEIAPDREIIDGAAIVRRVDDRGRFGSEAGEILRYRQAGDVRVGGQERFQRHRRGKLAGADQAARDIVDLLMDRLEEMRRLQKVGDAIERLVVDQDGAQQRLLCLDVVRGSAIAGLRLVLKCACRRFEMRHGCECASNAS